MYTPKQFANTDQGAILAFMKAFSFAAIVTAEDSLPLATHLPFTIFEREGQLVLSAHFAKANPQWRQLETQTSLVIFSEPHAYISPSHYDNPVSVPTWNYIAVHAYGKGRVITDVAEGFQALEAMIDNYEAGYRAQWNTLPEDYKLKMLNGIVPFEILVTDLQATEKLSQNKTAVEKERIINTLSGSEVGADRQIADYMKKLQ
jgi:transcriptional regulator